MPSRVNIAWQIAIVLVVTRRSAFELLHPRTHLFHIHGTITTYLTQLAMNFDGCRTTQMEKTNDYSLFLQRKRRHFRYEEHFLLAATARVLCAIQCCNLGHAFAKGAHLF
jgi:hypothetical protein